MATYTIEIEPEVDDQVKRQAKSHDMSVEEFVGTLIREGAGSNGDTSEIDAKSRRSGRELLEKWRQNGAMWRTEMVGDTVEYAQALREQTNRRNLRTSK